MGSFYDLLLASKLSGGGGGGGGSTAENALLDNTLVDYRNKTVTQLRGAAFSNLTNLNTLHLDAVTTLLGNSVINGSSVKTLVMPSLVQAGFVGMSYAFQGAASLEVADFGAVETIGLYAFNNDTHMVKLILRKNAVVTLGGVNAFNGTPYKSGGTGGEIYIPKSLYDHLGDNSANDYKAASNWSTVNGYGTITWKKIEGSIYETAYADGTPIS